MLSFLNKFLLPNFIFWGSKLLFLPFSVRLKIVTSALISNRPIWPRRIGNVIIATKSSRSTTSDRAIAMWQSWDRLPNSSHWLFRSGTSLPPSRTFSSRSNSSFRLKSLPAHSFHPFLLFRSNSSPAHFTVVIYSWTPRFIYNTHNSGCCVNLPWSGFLRSVVRSFHDV